MPPLKVVFDTNIFVMAAGMPGGYIDYWLELATPPGNKFKLYTSPAILAEVQEKLESRVHFERSLAVEYVDRIKGIAKVVNPTQKLNVVVNDPTTIRFSSVPYRLAPTLLCRQIRTC